MTTRRRPAVAVAVVTAVALAAAGCGTDEGGGTADSPTLRIATVDNPDVDRLQELSSHFTEQHPDITLEWVTFTENELRERVTTDIGTGAGQFDLVMLGAYEVAIWSDNEWLVPLADLPGEYDPDDLIPSVREALSTDDTLYALPFTGESSFTMYRADLFEQAGLTMPDQPTWESLLEAAEQLHDPASGVHGICLRGKAGWGENVALLTVMANSYGGRWFDEDWTPQLDSDAWTQALQTYVDLGAYAPDDAPDLGYRENLELFAQGGCAIWVDATAAASYVSDPEVSSVADDVAFALAPDAGHDVGSNWLWVWSLAVPESSEHQEEAEEFMTWATSPEYAELVASTSGWLHVPPGTRSSLYQNQEYTQAAPFADLVLASIESADPDDPTVDPVPYTGIQYVAVPEFQAIGTAVGNRATEALVGNIDVATAQQDAQWVTEQVSDRIRFIEE